MAAVWLSPNPGGLCVNIGPSSRMFLQKKNQHNNEAILNMPSALVLKGYGYVDISFIVSVLCEFYSDLKRFLVIPFGESVSLRP